MPFIKAGQIDRRIRIERAGAAVDDGYTRKKGGFVELATVWARVSPAPGAERVAAAQQAATAPTLFRIRWSPQVADVGPKDRIAYEGRSYDIKSAVELGRREAIDILAVARTDQAGG